MEARYLFLFELLVRLISVLLKIHSAGNTHPLVLLHLPSPVSLCSAAHFLNGISVSLCQFTSFLLAWGVIHCLYLSLFSFSLSFHSVSLAPLFKKIWHGIETGERLLFFWHTLPFLNQKQLRRNQVITLAVFLPSPSRPFFQFCSRSMKFNTLRRNRGQPVGQRKRAASRTRKGIAA